MATASSSISINPPAHENTADRTKRKRKKKSPPITSDADIHRRRLAMWKSAPQHQSYSSDLLNALSRLTINASTPSAPRGGRAVREVADRTLAVAAKGRTRWSRAILTSRVLKLSKFRKQRRANRATGKQSPSSNWRRSVNVVRLKGKSLAAVQTKVRVLGRLVPGCRKEALPVVLEEATDYIAALEMQVRAMTVLANLLSGSTIYNPSPT